MYSDKVGKFWEILGYTLAGLAILGAIIGLIYWLYTLRMRVLLARRPPAYCMDEIPPTYQSLYTDPSQYIDPDDVEMSHEVFVDPPMYVSNPNMLDYPPAYVSNPNMLDQPVYVSNPNVTPVGRFIPVSNPIVRRWSSGDGGQQTTTERARLSSM